MAGIPGREQPTTPASQVNYQSAVAQSQGQQQVSQQNASAAQLAPEEGGKGKSHPAIISLQATSKSSEMQVDFLAANNVAAEQSALAQSFKQFNPVEAQSTQPRANIEMELEEVSDRRTGNGQDRFKLTAQNLDNHEQQLLQQKSTGVRLMTASNLQLSNVAPQKAAQITIPIEGHPGSGGGQQPSITIPASNPGPGRPVGSNNAARQKKAQQQAAQAATQQNSVQNVQPSQVQVASTQPPMIPIEAQQAVVLSQSQQQQQQIILQQQIKAQQQQQQRPQMNQEQYLAYQQQQRSLQHQNSQNQIPGVHSAQQVEIIRHQQAQAQAQAFAAQQASQSGHQQTAPAYHGLTAADSQTHGKVIANTVRTRVSQNFQDKMTFLTSADKQHADSLAKQIKKEEFQFFLKNDDTRYYKKDLLEQKNQRMDEYISYCAENGGRVIPKQPEPITPPHETPLIIEMRCMHMELVEEAYWKRHMACLLARQCKQVAIKKAQEMSRRHKEEQGRLNEQQKREEQFKRDEQAKPASQLMVVDQIGVNGLRSQMIDTSIGAKIHRNSGLGREQDLLPQANLFEDDLIEQNVSFDDNIGEVDGYGNGIDILSMGGGMGIGLDEDMGLELIDPVPETIDHVNQGSGFPVDEADNYDDPFDPEQELRRQEEILEQQRIQESNKQEFEKLKKIEEIEKMSSQSDVNSNLSQRRVVKNLAEDSEMDSDKEDQLAALENEILMLDLVYLKPNTDKRERNLKQATDEEKKSVLLNQDLETANQSNQSKKILKTAKSVIKQKFDRLGQMLVENKGSCASEIIQSEQFQQLLANMAEEGEKKKPASDSLNDKLSTFLTSDQEIGIYVMPGIDVFEFDSDKDAIEEQNSCYEEINSADSDMDIDGFFTEINGYKKTAQNDKKVKKLRPPTIVGDEQQKLYEELKEINQLAPERSDLGHMQHLCRFWTEHQQEEIQEKNFIKEYLEKNLRLDDQGTRGDQQMDRKQRLALQQNIQNQRQTIEAYVRNLEKYQRPDYQPKELHRERFLLTGQEMPQQQHQQLAPQEFSFIKWYYALFPDQWRLIADIINYHPLTRGPLHCKEFMAREYFNRLDSNHRELLLGRQKIQMQPWRETKLPWLINGRESCLMNSMTYVNKSHLQSIHKVSRLTRKQRKIKNIYNFVVDSQGCLGLQFVRGFQPAQVVHQKPDNQFSQQEELKVELAGIKRIRAEIETDEDSAYDVEMDDSRQYSDSDVQDRLLSQMLARRRKDEVEEAMAAKLGIVSKEDVYRDRPYLKEMMVEIAQKRRKMDANTSQVIPQYTAFCYDPVKVQKDELDTNTPMWYALQNQKSCQMTIRVQHSTMFWLGYFIRRLMHEENLEKLKYISSDKIQIWEADNEIKNFFINSAKKIRLDEILSSQDQKEQQAALLRAQEKEEQELQKEIQHFLRAQVANPNRVEIDQVSDLWEGRSPYYYDREQKAEYMKQEKDYVERISNVMYQKSKHLWEELQFYWFQVNKNLNPRYRKIDQMQSLTVSDQPPQYPNSMQAQLRQQVDGYNVAAKQAGSMLAQPIQSASQITSLSQNNSLVLAQRQMQGVGQIGASSSQNMMQPSGNPSQSQYQMQNIQATVLSQSQIGQMSSAGVNPQSQYQATVQNRGQPLTPQSAQRRQQYPSGQLQQFGANGVDVQMQGQQSARGTMASQNSGVAPTSVQTSLPPSSSLPSNSNPNPQ